MSKQFQTQVFQESDLERVWTTTTQSLLVQPVETSLHLSVLMSLSILKHATIHQQKANPRYQTLLLSCLLLVYAAHHTHPFNGPLSGTTQVSRYQKGKTNLDFTAAREVSGSGIS